MRSVVSALVVLASIAVDPTAVAARPPLANPFSTAPDAPKAGEPVAVRLTLAGAGPAVGDVDVLIRGHGVTRRFPAVALGRGHYRATITFPWAGGWAVVVRYGGGIEVPLGKGGGWVDGVPRPGNVVARALVLAFSDLAAAVSRSANRGSRPPPG